VDVTCATDDFVGDGGERGVEVGEWYASAFAAAATVTSALAAVATAVASAPAVTPSAATAASATTAAVTAASVAALIFVAHGRLLGRTGER
jgi:hypothetical protein